MKNRLFAVKWITLLFAIVCAASSAWSQTTYTWTQDVAGTYNWSDPANWYAFGRLAWDPDLAPEVIAEEWTAMTFSCGADARRIINGILMKSYDALVHYSMPLGLNLLCDWNHYDPKPAMRAAYHHADSTGLGFDRTATGSKAVEQYHPQRAAIWADREKIPLQYLLWFHHVPWHDTLPTGRSLWAELKGRYAAGVAIGFKKRICSLNF